MDLNIVVHEHENIPDVECVLESGDIVLLQPHKGSMHYYGLDAGCSFFAVPFKTDELGLIQPDIDNARLLSVDKDTEIYKKRV